MLRYNFALFTLVSTLLAAVVGCGSDSEPPSSVAAPDSGGADGAAAETQVIDEARCAQLERQLGIVPLPELPAPPLHAGVDEASGALYPACLGTEHAEFAAGNGYGAFTVGLSSQSELADALGANSHADGALDLNAAQKRDFLRSIQFPAQSAVWMAQFEVVLGSHGSALPPGYNDRGRAARATPQQFRAACGDSYVSEVSVGGIIIILHVVDLTQGDALPMDFQFTFSDVLYRDKRDPMYPHRRYILRVGGGTLGTDVHGLDEAQSHALFACHGMLLKKYPANFRAFIRDYPL